MQSLPIILPHGWAQVRDPVSGRIYYANAQTNESRWDPPPLPPPPPPPVFANVVSNVSLSFSASAPEISSSTNQAPVTSDILATQQLQQLNSNFLVPATISLLQVETQRKKLLQQLHVMGNNSSTTGGYIPTTPEVELPSLSAGQLADLCRIQKELAAASSSGDLPSNNNDCYYKPLDVANMPLMSKPTHIESGRADVRIQNLMNELKTR